VLDYSVNARSFASNEHFNNILYFFKKVVEEGRSPNLPEVQDLKCEVLSDRIKAVAETGKIPPKSVCLYVSEGSSDPETRLWTKVKEVKPEKDAQSVEFEYFPKRENSDVYFFVRSTFEKGFKAGSNVVMKRTDGIDIKVKSTNKVIFSSREDYGETVFFVVKPNLKTPIDYVGDYSVKREKGPMDIEGVSCLSGLQTIKTLSYGDLPEDSVLVMDIYVKKDSLVKISLIRSQEGKYDEYSCYFKLNGEEIWHNVKAELSKFKSNEGGNLRSFDGVRRLKIEADGEFILNNALWV
jgi:hypothetical protein